MGDMPRLGYGPVKSMAALINRVFVCLSGKQLHLMIQAIILVLWIDPIITDGH